MPHTAEETGLGVRGKGLGWVGDTDGHFPANSL